MIAHTVLTHYPASLADQMMVSLQALAGGDAAFLLAYGGSREEYEKLKFVPKVFLEDPFLRGKAGAQNYTEWLKVTWKWQKGLVPLPSACHFTEADHIVLKAAYWKELENVLSTRRASFFGKNCYCCESTNSHWRLEYQYNKEVISEMASISVRDTTSRLWTAIANGMLIRPEAMEAFCSNPPIVQCYTEILVPSRLYHLGFELEDFASSSDIFRSVRFRPVYAESEVETMISGRTMCVHPFKDREALPRILKQVNTRFSTGVSF